MSTAETMGPPSRRRSAGKALLVAAVAAVLVTVAAIWWAPGGHRTTGARAGGDRVPGYGPAPAGALSTSPAGPAASTSPAPGTGTGPPSPFVQPFATGLTGSPKPPLPSPSGTLSQPVNVDGCDHNYGPPGVCVPWTFPPGVTDRCGWLRSHGYQLPLAVHGTDRQGLDPNHDGSACGSGD